MKKPLPPFLLRRYAPFYAVFAFFLCAQILHGQYDAERTRYRAQDAISPPPSNAVLFVGSSSIRLWEGLTQDFSDYHVIQRGFGGSTIGDLQKFAGSNATSTAGDALAKNVVQSYNPRAIVVWSGTNDVRPGSSGAYVADGFQNFVSLVRAQLPNTRIFYLGITKNPYYLGDAAANQRRIDANTLIQSYIATSGDSRLYYIDLPSLFETLSTTSIPLMWDYYVDSLHTNKAGYALWTNKIRADLAAAGILPDKTYTPNPLAPSPGSKILFDFGAINTTNGNQTLGADANGNTWNNWTAINGATLSEAGEYASNLVDSTGAATGIKLITTGPFKLDRIASEIPLTQNATALGDLATPNAAQDFFKWSGSYPAGFYLSGLEPTRAYELRFYGSKNGTATLATRFTAVGNSTASATITTSGTGIGDGGVNYNTRNVAVLTNVIPNQFGEIHVDIAAAQGGEAHMNAMRLFVLSQRPVSITTPPTASSITLGQSLASSTLSGGSARFNGTPVQGSFAFENSQLMPAVGNSTQRIVFTPADSGNFTTATVDLPVTVTPALPAADTLLIDFGSGNATNGSYFTSGPDSNGNVWNNFTTASPTIGNLVFTNNATSGISLAGNGTIDGAAAGGFGVANGTVNLPNPKMNIFTAYTDGIYTSNATATLTFSGLSATKRYSFELFGARSATATRTTQYTIISGNGNATANLTTSGNGTGTGGVAYNTSNTAIFTNLPPDGLNRITLQLRDLVGGFSYLNALQIKVLDTIPTISVPPVASSITYGQTLANATLSGGNASTAGSFAFVSSSIAPPVGNSTQVVRFTPTDFGNFTTTTTNVTVTVDKATPVVITPPGTTPIALGQSVGSSTLNGGNASVPGTFEFASPGDIPVAGDSIHAVVFTPADSGNYTIASVYVTVSTITPNISIRLASGASMTNGGASASIGGAPVGESLANQSIVISNSGFAPLGDFVVSKSGDAAADFAIGAISSNSIASGSNATITIQFTPSAVGNRTALISISSNDPDDNPFIVNLSGTGLSAANDSDGDGLSDVAEFRYASLGFDWQTPNTQLAATLLDHANDAGLFTADQMHSLSVGLPVLSRNATTGVFTLKLRLSKSTNLQNFQPMPFTQNGTFVNPATGEVEFDFTSPENAAFFRIQAE